MPSKPNGRVAVLFVCLYMFCLHINTLMISNYARLHLFYFTASDNFNRITVY